MSLDQIEVKNGDVYPCRFLLYMDVLGTRQMMDGNYKEILRLKKFIQKISSNSRKYRENINEKNGLDIDPEISNFSDHIAISYPLSIEHLNSHSEMWITNSLISIASQIYQFALEHGILMRGAITKGILWHEGSNILGKALIEAAELEEKVAIYPRVIISANVIDSFKKYVSPSIIRRDFDGIYFVDYLKHPQFIGGGNVKEAFESSLPKIRKIIDDNLKNKYIKNDIRKLTKWHWLAAQFDQSLDYFNEKFKDTKAILAEIKKFFPEE